MAFLAGVVSERSPMMPMIYCVASRGWPGYMDCIRTWKETASEQYSMYICMGLDVVPAMQLCYESTREPILAYLHDDVEIHEKDWDKRVLKEFEDETVGLVGFAGGRGHCRPELYRVPYFLPNLARQTFLSNMRSWQTHGERFTAECDVAVLDGCVLFVRRSVLDHVQGWMKAEPYGYWLYSEWLCCETRRQGLTIRLVGIDFEHLGGKSSGSIATKPSYEEAHRFLFENNRDVLPFRVE